MGGTVNVYWASGSFASEQEAWHLLYPEPRMVLQDVLKKYRRGGLVPKCPAVVDVMKNVYSFHSAINETIKFEPGFLNQYVDSYDTVHMPVDCKISLVNQRSSSFDGYVNVNYNMSWAFYSDEPLLAKFTAPYYPVATPTPGALFGTGVFDIGQWYRDFNLDYHIPVDSKSFVIKKNDPLFFVEFLTDKKINFVKYQMTSTLMAIKQEMSRSSQRYGTGMKLFERYQMAKNSRVMEMVSKEIKNNIVGDRYAVLHS